MKKFLFFILLLTVFNAHARSSLFDGLGLSNNDDVPPLVEEAFQFRAEVNDANSILAHWKVLEGNYLYRDKLQFDVIGNDKIKLGNISFPAGENKQDETFGLVEVYHDALSVIIPIKQRPEEAVTFTLKALFQGCSEKFGICYPPSEQQIDLALPAISGAVEQDIQGINPPAASQLTEQDRIAQKLEQENLGQIILGFIGLGLLLAFTPCIFPMIPILSSIIVGEGEHITTRRAFTLSLVYVLAMSVTYTIAGVVTGLLGENLQAMFQNPWIISAFSALFVILALSMFGLYELQLPHSVQHRLHQLSHKQQGGKLMGVAIMGLLSGLIVGPCLAPPLAGTLIFIGQHADPVLGGLALFSLSIGMGIPLLIIGTSAGKLLPKAGNWMLFIKSIFGVLLLGLAIWMLERIIPGWLTMSLWGGLLIVSAVYLGAFNRLDIDATDFNKLNKGLGLILFIYGTLLMVGGASGSQNVWQPLHGIVSSSGKSAETQHLAFTQIADLDELNQRLASTTQPIMLDFYADWCTECKTMERTTFQDPDVLAAMKGYTLLQLDMTENTQVHQEMLKALRVFGPPTMLFFDKTGQELSQHRLVGFVKADTFLDHIRQMASQP
ncbi:thiol:disulfide interchange protein DsbD [Methylophaga marina]|uniref:Thiol:disulfide interchange protein DsbD n=1 Tax=Methylophaga marina TaxID=45495 RepID=A0ABN0TZE3_9GAMM|nr:protein-disulfide reductase DsbD [Methylophaga marina]BDZ74026.1 thiol:disulfide interchange protein DsbD [Methylophaga marina]